MNRRDPEEWAVYVCSCQGLTEADIRRAARWEPISPERLIQILALDDDDCCGRCADGIDELVALLQTPAKSAHAA